MFAQKYYKTRYSAVIVMVGLGKQVRIINKAISRPSDSEIMKKLEDEDIQIYHPLLETKVHSFIFEVE